MQLDVTDIQRDSQEKRVYGDDVIVSESVVYIYTIWFKVTQGAVDLEGQEVFELGESSISFNDAETLVRDRLDDMR